MCYEICCTLYGMCYFAFEYKWQIANGANKEKRDSERARERERGDELRKTGKIAQEKLVS